MRILLLTLGSRGDVQPYVALGAVLKARGHYVTLSTGKGFDPLIESHGLKAAALSVDIQALLAQPDIQRAMHSLKGKIDAWRSTRALMQRQLDDIGSVCREADPEIIVYHPKAFVAPYLARAAGVVAIPSFLQPGFLPTGDFPNALTPMPDLGRSLNKLANRMMSGLMRLGHRAMLRPWLARHPALRHIGSLDVLRGYHPSGKPVPRLHAFSRHLAPKPADWDGDDHVTGAWFLHRAQGWTPPDELTSFLHESEPPLYIGFGSMPSIDPEKLTRSVLAALDRSGLRAVLSTGWGALEQVAPSRRVHVLEEAPHDWLLPRCAGVVHHGGAGTTHEGLRCGRPMLICPVFGDQPFWGRRVAALGAGPTPISLADIDADRLAGAFVRLRVPTVAKMAASLGGAIREERGAEAAADLIEAAGA